MTRDYAKFLGMSHAHLKEFFRSSGKLQNKDLAALFAFSGQPPSFFGINKEMTFFTEGIPDQYEFMSFNDWVHENKEEGGFISAYFEKIIDKVKRAEESIFIFDFLINNGQALSGENRQKFFGGYRDHFKTIEDQLEKSDLDYTRIIGFPPDQRALPRFLFENISNKKIQCIKLGIFLMLDKTFEHLCGQFKKENLKLYVLPVSPRHYSIMIIDKKYVMTEYFRVRKDKQVVPDLLFINKANNKSKNYAERLRMVYDREFTELIGKDRAIPISAEMFSSCTFSLLEDVRKIIGQLSNEKRSPENILKLGKLRGQEEELSKKAKALIDHGLL